MPTKTCRCGKEYFQYTSLQNRCPKCLADRARKAREKRERSEHRKAKAGLETWREANKKAQASFNKLRRLMEKGKPCCSCGRDEAEVEYSESWKPGGAWDCGHYLTRGARPDLRFIFINTWRQCKSCNGGSGKYTRKNHTVGQEYKERLIDRIGIEAVEWLEGPPITRKYSIEELREIKTECNKWARELEKSRD